MGVVQAEKNREVMDYGLKLLAGVNPSRAYPAFIGMLEADSAVLRAEAKLTLKKLTGEGFDKPEEWRSWWETQKDSYR